MRGAVCILLSFMLLFALSSVREPFVNESRAWWGLLFPQVFAQPDGSEQVTFVWPFFDGLWRILKMNG